MQTTLREAQRQLTGIVDLGKLFQVVLQTVEQTLQPHWAAFFILRSDGTVLRRIRVIGKDQEGTQASTAPLREILSNHPLLQYCEDLAKKGKFPVLLDQILENEIDRSASRVQREHFAR